MLAAIGVGFIYISGIIAVIVADDNRKRSEEDSIVRCIDSGGYPVTLRTHVKGIGKGNVCIKSVELVN